nr:MAG TPA: hypothetical protein [Bacteriophage sp.]
MQSISGVASLKNIKIELEKWSVSSLSNHTICCCYFPEFLEVVNCPVVLINYIKRSIAMYQSYLNTISYIEHIFPCFCHIDVNVLPYDFSSFKVSVCSYSIGLSWLLCSFFPYDFYRESDFTISTFLFNSKIIIRGKYSSEIKGCSIDRKFAIL